ncbi:hypothetical protein BDV09DRAFT_186404 [Aspergillus tetrazonus]
MGLWSPAETEFQSVASLGKNISRRQERPKEGYFRGTSSRGKASKLKEQLMKSMRSTGCGIPLRNQRYLVASEPENAGGNHMLQSGLMTVATIPTHHASASSSQESIGNWLVDMRTAATWLYINGPSTALPKYAVCVYRVFARVRVNQQKGCGVEVICNLALTPENFKPVKPRPSHRTRAPVQAPLNCLCLQTKKLRFLKIPHPLKKHTLVGMRPNHDTDGPGGLKPWFATISTSINISELIIGRLNLSEPGTR